MIKIKIAHYICGKINIPGAVSIDGDYIHELELEKVEDILTLCQDHGNFILSAPGHNPHKEDWFIWVTDKSGHFKQK